MKMNVAVIGAGLLGRKRGLVLLNDPNVTVRYVADLNLDAAQTLAQELNAVEAVSDWKTVTRSKDVDAIVITTPNFLHAPMGSDALENGKHVLCEKPLTTLLSDAEAMVSIAKKNQLVLKTGFNHRHFPHILKAKEICESGQIGRLYFIRAHYGHGGRAGYDKEWRGKVELSGGGEMMDQGVHLVDLFRWFMGDFSEVQGVTQNYHWGSDTIEDNAFFTLTTPQNQVAQAHVSWTQWKNSFSFEVFGETGYLRLAGLAGYYGKPQLTLGVKTTKSVVPQETVFEFDQEDQSFALEWQCFKTAIQNGSPVMADGQDGLNVLKTVLAVYESHKSGKRISI